MSDRWALVLAAAAAGGALLAAPLPLAPAVALLLAAALIRWPPLLCLAVAVLSSTLAQRALAGLDDVEQGRVRGTAVLVSDPEPVGDSLRAEARIEGRRVQLWASSAVAAQLRDRLAGDGVVLTGRSQAIELDPWLRSRHISGRVEVWSVEGWQPARGPAAWANGLRRLLERSTASLPDDRRALFSGLVVGDDRRQPLSMADDFRGAGLTHLLAVSGQNVAFVLALLSPGLRRLRLWPRMLAALAAIALFALVTRFEPSVLRAGGVAALAVVAATIGRPAARVRLLALAITGLLLVDPLLVHSVGFQLSAAAAAAIVVLAPRLTDALPGPSWLRAPLAVTVAAQLGVAPLLLASFGPLPVASLPANLLAVPAAGFVMAWGLVAGPVAGLMGGELAALLHAPTSLALAWVAGVARLFARAPLGNLGPVHVAAAAAALLAAMAFGHRSVLIARLGIGVATLSVVAAVAAAQAPVSLRSSPLPGVALWRSGGATVVVLGEGGGDRSPPAARLLAALRVDGVRRVDALVVASEGLDTGAGALVQRYDPGLVLGPQLGETRWLPLGEVQLMVLPAGERLVVEVDRLDR